MRTVFLPEASFNCLILLERRSRHSSHVCLRFCKMRDCINPWMVAGALSKIDGGNDEQKLQPTNSREQSCLIRIFASSLDYWRNITLSSLPGAEIYSWILLDGIKLQHSKPFLALLHLYVCTRLLDVWLRIFHAIDIEASFLDILFCGLNSRCFGGGTRLDDWRVVATYHVWNKGHEPQNII